MLPNPRRIYIIDIIYVMEARSMDTNDFRKWRNSFNCSNGSYIGISFCCNNTQTIMLYYCSAIVHNLVPMLFHVLFHQLTLSYVSFSCVLLFICLPRSPPLDSYVAERYIRCVLTVLIPLCPLSNFPLFIFLV